MVRYIRYILIGVGMFKIDHTPFLNQPSDFVSFSKLNGSSFIQQQSDDDLDSYINYDALEDESMHYHIFIVEV